MPALRVHQHRVDDVRVALPLPPRAFRPAGLIERVTPLEHDAFDRLRVFAGAGRRRLLARGSELVPGREGDERREVDAGFVEPGDEAFQPRAALGERKVAQILLAVGEEIIGAQMRGKFGHELCRDGFAVEPLLQHVEGCTRARA